GILEAARIFLDQGAAGIAVSDLQDAGRLRQGGIAAPVLLYGATDPALAAQVVELQLTPTVFDRPGLEAYARLDRPVDLWVEVDCGMGRLGLVPDEWEIAFRRLRQLPALRLQGLYTHIVALEQPE